VADREEDDTVAHVRVYCGLSSTQPSGVRPAGTSAAVTSAAAWLTLAVVDDSGRLLDVIDITDDPTGYAILGAVLAQRSGGSGDVAVAVDHADHQVSMLLAAAGRPLAVAEREDLDDYAERFGDDDSPEEMAAPPSERRAVGLARALQAGAVGAAVQAAPRELTGLKPVLAAHSAVASGRQSAAVALREVLRELYPAALRAYPDPCEPVPLAVLDALPEPAMLAGGGDAAVMAALTAARVGDSDQIGEAITALRVAIAETPRRSSVGSSATGAVAETIRQSVAAVRACDAGVTALVALLTEKATLVVAGATVAGTRAGAAAAGTRAGAATAGPVRTGPVAADALAGRARAAARESAARESTARETTSPAQAEERSRGGRAGLVTPLRPMHGAGSAPGQSGAGSHAARANAPSGNSAQTAARTPAGQPTVGAHASGANGDSAQPTAAQVAAQSAGSGLSSRRSRNQAYPNEKVPAPRPSPEVAAPGSRTEWPLANSGAYQEVPREVPRQPAGNPTAARGPAGAPPGGNGSVGSGGPAATSYGPLEVPPTVLDTNPGSGLPSRVPAPPAQPATPPGRSPGRVPPPWQDDQLPPEPPALHLVEPVSVGDYGPLGTDPLGSDRFGTDRFGTDRFGGYGASGRDDMTPQDDTMRLRGDSFRSRRPEEDDPLGDGYAMPPLRLISGGDSDNDSDSDLLIFAAAKSAWFTGDSEVESTLEWSNPADAGWQAAERLIEPVHGEETSAGLPRRVPQANLVPGSAFPPASTRNLRVVRDPAAIAAHTTGYFRGSRRAGEVHGFAVGGRPGRESATGWDFSRDGWESDHDEGYEYRSAARR
jgi:hypothetical protein